MKKIDVHIVLPKHSDQLRKLIVQQIDRSGLQLMFEEDDVATEAHVQSVEVPFGAGCTDTTTGEDVSGVATAESIQRQIRQIERELGSG